MDVALLVAAKDDAVPRTHKFVNNIAKIVARASDRKFPAQVNYLLP